MASIASGVSHPVTIEWIGDAHSGFARALDQTRLPQLEHRIAIESVAAMVEAIRSLRVRGAPLIGVAAAYGCVLGARGGGDLLRAMQRFTHARQELAATRPTAVNLFWALARMEEVALRTCGQSGVTVPVFEQALLDAALAIHRDDEARCRAIGEHGAGLIRPGERVLTYCNAGALATGGMGTALAPLYIAHQRGVSFSVIACETRPLLQGARLTAWELQRAGIDLTLICDGAAASTMRARKVSRVLVGADRIALNGDVANKIGTLGIALAAQTLGIPVTVCAPLSTFDLTCASGANIEIEERSADEVRSFGGVPCAPPKVSVYAPAFDVTPAPFIASIITERGMLSPVNQAGIRAILGSA